MGPGQWPGNEPPNLRAQTADDLRELIRQAELIVGNLRTAGARAQTLLFLLDAIHDLVARLQDTGIDLRPEATRIETVERLLASKDSILVREMRRLGGMAAARESSKPAPAQWWWFLDQRVAERRRRQWQQLLLAGGGVLVILLVLTLLYRFVFPPDPNRLAAMDRTTQAERALREGDLAAALAYYQEAAEFTPDDPELHVWIGVLEEHRGQGELAAQAYATAHEHLADPVRFHLLRGTSWQRLQVLDRAEAEGQAALTLDPDCMEAHFLLGGVYEAQADFGLALFSFQRAAELAEKANNSAMVVLARTRMGMLLQAGPRIFPDQTGTPAP